MVTTRSRHRGREHARPSTGGTAAEHATKIYGAAMVSIVVIIAVLALTSAGHTIDAATQHFMLFYAGVFALLALCASVGLGLVATDRMIMNPGHRILVQAAHRAASFGAVAFLIIHITTEILAQRVHVLDAVIPFLSPYRTFYIGLGTIASDLVILLVITGIMRSRFNANGNAWRWRAIHYASYASFVFGVWHGLLAGRAAKPYVDWSYGFVIALVLLGLAVRIMSDSRRPKESLSTSAADLSSGPLRVAAMYAQSAAARRTGPLGAVTGSQPLLTATGGQPLLTSTGASPGLTALSAGTVPDAPFYEPGYEGPARYLGAPAPTGTGPLPRAATGPMPAAGTGRMPRHATGSMPRAATGPIPRPPTGPIPRAATGPIQRPPTGPIPRAATGPIPGGPTDFNDGMGGGPRPATGPMPRAAGGPVQRPPTGPIPRHPTGPLPRPATGPLPRAATGPLPRPATGPLPRPATGPLPRHATGPLPRNAAGPLPRPATGPIPRPATGPLPQAGARPLSRPATGPLDFGAPGAPGGNGRPGQPGPPNPGWQDPGSGWQDPNWEYPEPADGWYPGEQHWDGEPPLRYREPGPGMPGYRGSRDQRYGGDA